MSVFQHPFITCQMVSVVRYFDVPSSSTQANEVEISTGLFVKASVMLFVKLTRILHGGFKSDPRPASVYAIQNVPPAPGYRCRENEQVYHRARIQYTALDLRKRHGKWSELGLPLEMQLQARVSLAQAFAYCCVHSLAVAIAWAWFSFHA